MDYEEQSAVTVSRTKAIYFSSSSSSSSASSGLPSTSSRSSSSFSGTSVFSLGKVTSEVSLTIIICALRVGILIILVFVVLSGFDASLGHRLSLNKGQPELLRWGKGEVCCTYRCVVDFSSSSGSGQDQIILVFVLVVLILLHCGFLLFRQFGLSLALVCLSCDRRVLLALRDSNMVDLVPGSGISNRARSSHHHSLLLGFLVEIGGCLSLLPRLFSRRLSSLGLFLLLQRNFVFGHGSSWVGHIGVETCVAEMSRLVG